VVREVKDGLAHYSLSAERAVEWECPQINSRVALFLFELSDFGCSCFGEQTE
jgi:hypothetical protein